MRVVLVGGFACPPAMLRPLSGALRRRGHEVTVAPLGFNVGCGEEAAGRVADVVTTVGASGGVAVVGHSRGGQIARVVSVRHPELVERLVTVATPWTIGPPARRVAAIGTAVLHAAQRFGANPIGSLDCATGACCAQLRADIARTPAARWVALWSRRDRIGGRDAVPPSTVDVVVETGLGHILAVTSGDGIAQIVDALVA